MTMVEQMSFTGQ